MAYNFSPKIVTDGLVLYLDAANTRSYPRTGTTWSDISRGGYTGTLENFNNPSTQTIFDPANGGSIIFDGTDDWVNSGTQILKGLQEFTINLWFFTSTLTGTLLSEGASSNVGVQFWLGAGVNNTILQFGDGTNDSYFNSKITLQQNVWVNLCFTVKNKTGTSYINSVYQNAWTNTNNISWAGTTGTFRLGCRENISTFTNSRIAITQLYNRALSSTEIQQNYNATKPRFGL
jgi:hypothetical protein